MSLLEKRKLKLKKQAENVEKMQSVISALKLESLKSNNNSEKSQENTLPKRFKKHIAQGKTSIVYTTNNKNKFLKVQKNSANMINQEIKILDYLKEKGVLDICQKNNNSLSPKTPNINIGNKHWILFPNCGLSIKNSFNDISNMKEILEQCLLILKNIHKENVVHCDIKLDNIMIKNGKALLIDFGLSKLYDEIDNDFLKYVYLDYKRLLRDYLRIKIEKSEGTEKEFLEQMFWFVLNNKIVNVFSKNEQLKKIVNQASIEDSTSNKIKNNKSNNKKQEEIEKLIINLIQTNINKNNLDNIFYAYFMAIIKLIFLELLFESLNIKILKSF